MRILCLLLSVLSLSSAAQPSYPSRSVPEHLAAGLKGRVCDSLSHEPLIHAVVRAIGVRDTLYRATDREGCFSFEALAAPQEYRLTCSFLGYVDKTFAVSLQTGTVDLGTLPMVQRDQRIEAVEVRERAQLVSFHGDTVQYNVTAVKVLEGSETAELVRRLPGLTVDESGYASFNGQMIRETRVNDRLIFGKDPRNALQNLPAADVIKVQIYDTPEQGRRERKKVMNLTTRFKIDWNFSVNALGSYGADTERGPVGRQQRYGGGGEINFFSERHRIKTDFGLNNMGRMSNRLPNILKVRSRGGYMRQGHADVSYEIQPKKGVNAMLGYRYANDYQSVRKILQQIYFPQETVAERIYADTATSKSLFATHAVQAGLEREGRRVSGKLLLGFNCKDRVNRDGNRTELSDAEAGVIRAANMRCRTDENSYGATAAYELYFNYPDAGGRSTGIEGTAELGNGDGSELRLDTLSASSQRTDLTIGSTDRNRAIDVTVRHTEYLLENLYVAAEYQYDYRYEKSYRLAWDNYRNSLDSVQTGDYTFDYSIHRGQFTVRYDNGRLNLHGGVACQHALQNRTERIIFEGNDRMRFVNWLPLANIDYRVGRASINLAYRSSAELPSCEMIRARLDTRNPLQLKVGNPDLKSSVKHHLELIGRWMGKKASCEFMIRGDFIVDPIVGYRQRLVRDTVFTAYGGYRAAAGTIFNSYDNAGGEQRVSASAAVSLPVRWLGCRLRFSPQFSYTRIPEYADRRLVYTVGHIYGGHLSLSSTFSRKFDFKITGLVNYGDVRNGNADRADYLRTRVTADVKWHFLSRGFFYVQYDLTNYRSYSGLLRDQTDNSLNAVLGVNFARDNRCSFSIAAYDLLGSVRAFTSKLGANYLLNTWQNTAGRYFTCNFCFRFNKSGQR